MNYQQYQFYTFFCHNSNEKPQVERIRNNLQHYGVYAWLDKYDFEPFRPWQEQLEQIIPQIHAAAIFIGPSGIGPWANIEMREFLVEFTERRIRMGLVILPGCPEETIKNVPRFLKSFQWVDFRQQLPDPMTQLIWGITGQRPSKGYTSIDTVPIYVLLYNAGTQNEGIHTIKFEDRNKILIFESSEDAYRFSLKLQQQNFPVPTVEQTNFDEVVEFCRRSDHDYDIVPAGSQIEPPTKNISLPDYIP